MVLAGVAQAGPVWFILDTFPVNLGRHIKLDFDPSKLVSKAETPDSVSFDLPARWRLDTESVARECTPSQAAAVRCRHGSGSATSSSTSTDFCSRRVAAVTRTGSPT
jgi:hypothetical protein